jgi:hypothetical protein
VPGTALSRSLRSARLVPRPENGKPAGGDQRKQFRAVVVLPQPKVPFSQTITWSCYEHTSAHAADSVVIESVVRVVDGRSGQRNAGWCDGNT